MKSYWFRLQEQIFKLCTVFLKAVLDLQGLRTVSLIKPLVSGLVSELTITTVNKHRERPYERITTFTVSFQYSFCISKKIQKISLLWKKKSRDKNMSLGNM